MQRFKKNLTKIRPSVHELCDPKTNKQTNKHAKKRVEISLSASPATLRVILVAHTTVWEESEVHKRAKSHTRNPIFEFVTKLRHPALNHWWVITKRPQKRAIFTLLAQNGPHDNNLTKRSNHHTRNPIFEFVTPLYHSYILFVFPICNQQSDMPKSPLCDRFRPLCGPTDP